MKRRSLWLAMTIPAFVMTLACDTALTVGSKTVGIRSGEFIYTDGYLRTTYNFPLAVVWEACEKTLTDLKATEVSRIRKIATGTFTAMVQDEKVQISVEYVEKEMTSVSILTGTGGNNLASQLIHDRLAGNLAKP